MGVLVIALTVAWLGGSATPSLVSADVPLWAWDLLPKEGRAYFLGFCPRLKDREEERSACLREAAFQASKLEHVTVRARMYDRRMLLFTRHEQRVEIDLDEGRIEQLTARLVAVREHRCDEGTYVLAALDSVAMPSASAFVPPPSDWIENGYDLPGYYTAVGVAQKKRLFSGSIEAADDDALVGLSLLLSSETESGLLDSPRRAPGRYRYEKTEASIRGFLVIARARSRDGRYYYSLAVCPEDKNRQ